LIYFLTAIGLPPGGSSTVHTYTKTIHRTTQNKQYIEQHKHFGRVRDMSKTNHVLRNFAPTCIDLTGTSTPGNFR
jgi:hypothetical protein